VSDVRGTDLRAAIMASTDDFDMDFIVATAGTSSLGIRYGIGLEDSVYEAPMSNRAPRLPRIGFR
jgi:hypothetical protein